MIDLPLRFDSCMVNDRRFEQPSRQEFSLLTSPHAEALMRRSLIHRLPFIAGLVTVLSAAAPQAHADFIAINGPGPGGIPPQMVGTIPEPLIPGVGVPADPFPGFSNGVFSVTATSVEIGRAHV
jgi:hypothetical protein